MVILILMVILLRVSTCHVAKEADKDYSLDYNGDS